MRADELADSLMDTGLPRPRVDIYRRNYKDRSEWIEDPGFRPRTETKSRAKFEHSVLQAARDLHAARVDARNKGEYSAKDVARADISFSAISRIGGVAALGTVIGTAIVPGIGTVIGAVLGGVVGGFAFSALSHKKSERRGNEQATPRVR